MIQANVLETKNELSKFIRLLETGQEDCIIVARHNKPVAKITLLPEEEKRCCIGIAESGELYREGWDSQEINDEAAALFGADS